MLQLREPYHPKFADSYRRRAKVGASASIIKQAAAIAAAKLGESNLAAIQTAVAIGILETDLGTSGSWICSGGNCSDLEDGDASYNWGGLVGKGTAGSIDHGDRNPDGTPTHYNFQAFHSMAQAFAAFYATWSRGDASIDRPQSVIPHERTVLAAASRGDALAVAATMYAHKYFGGVAGNDQARILAYAKAIVGAAAVVAAALGQPALVTLRASGSDGGAGGGGVGGALAWAALGAAVAGVGLWAVL